jgi:hypothetical protein
LKGGNSDVPDKEATAPKRRASKPCHDESACVSTTSEVKAELHDTAPEKKRPKPGEHKYFAEGTGEDELGQYNFSDPDHCAIV